MRPHQRLDYGKQIVVPSERDLFNTDKVTRIMREVHLNTLTPLNKDISLQPIKSPKEHL